MKKPYEMLVILDAKLDEEKRNDIIEDVKRMLEEREGEITLEDKWNIKKFAYNIKKREEGYYVNFEFLIPPDKLKEVRHNLRLKREILRFLILKKEE